MKAFLAKPQYRNGAYMKHCKRKRGLVLNREPAASPFEQQNRCAFSRQVFGTRLRFNENNTGRCGGLCRNRGAFSRYRGRRKNSGLRRRMRRVRPAVEGIRRGRFCPFEKQLNSLEFDIFQGGCSEELELLARRFSSGFQHLVFE